MSWQQYVDSNLVGTGTVTAAGIYDKAGNPWAYSAGFAAQVAEVKVVADALATAIDVMGPDAGFAMAERENLAVYLVVKTTEGFETRVSTAFQNYLKDSEEENQS